MLNEECSDRRAAGEQPAARAFPVHFPGRPGASGLRWLPTSTKDFSWLMSEDAHDSG